MIATLFETWNDRHGDLNKRADLVWRVILILAEAGLLAWVLHKPFIDSILLSSAIFFMTFDYLVAYVLIKNKVVEPRRGTTYTWWTYTAKKGFFDNIGLWRRLSPWVKFFVKLICLAISLYILSK